MRYRWVLGAALLVACASPSTPMQGASSCTVDAPQGGVLERVGGVYQGVLVKTAGPVVTEIAYFWEGVRIELVRGGCAHYGEVYHFDMSAVGELTDRDPYLARAVQWLERMHYKEGAVQHRDVILEALAGATPPQREACHVPLVQGEEHVNCNVEPGTKPDTVRVSVGYVATL